MVGKDRILLNSASKVKNAVGTGDDEPEGASSWKEFYEERHAWPKTCRIYGCGEVATDGAHVKIKKKRKEWIIPMCDDHNHPSNKAWMHVNKGTWAFLEKVRS